MSFWHGKSALVTGGCSFIGSHLVDALIAHGATVRIADDLSSGTRANVQHLLDVCTNMAEHELRHRAQVVTELEPVPAIDAPEGRLLHVFVNLLINAAHAITPGNVFGNEVRIVAARKDGNRVLVEVRDTGEGIAPELVPHIFDPFVTTRPFGTGTGLGLAVCHGILTDLGGCIEVESVLGVGTVFRLELPSAAGAAIELVRPSAAPSPVRAGRRARILLVDDEPMMRVAIRRTLEAEHDIVAPDTAIDAFALLERGRRFDVILCDLMMPDMTGMELYEQTMRIEPDQGRRIVFLSGGAYTNTAIEFLRSVPNRQVEKPFDSGKLRDLIDELVESWGPAAAG